MKGIQKYVHHQVKFEHTKEVIRICKSKENCQLTMTKRKRTNNKILQRKLRIEQHKLHLEPGVNSGTPEGLTVSAP